MMSSPSSTSYTAALYVSPPLHDDPGANYSLQTVTIFAYGVTSSGKTHTMQGTRSDPGVIPRVVQAMFERREEMTKRADLAVSYMEIYKDDVYDLLVQRENVRWFC